MKCQSIRCIFVSTSKMTEMIYSDADFTVPQSVIKSYRLCNNSDFTVAQCAIKSSTVAVRTYAFNKPNLASTTHPLLWVYINTCPPAMYLHTSLTHYRDPHALPSWTCLVTWSLHETSLHSAVVVNKQSLPHLWYWAHMEGDVGCVLTLTQVAP
jgi:hypothetical protein